MATSNMTMVFLVSFLITNTYIICLAADGGGARCVWRDGACKDTPPFVNGRGRCERISRWKECSSYGYRRCRCIALRHMMVD